MHQDNKHVVSANHAKMYWLILQQGLNVNLPSKLHVSTLFLTLFFVLYKILKTIMCDWVAEHCITVNCVYVVH